jgi:D-tyrosyl-tRNA(Tyr) deacylase
MVAVIQRCRRAQVDVQDQVLGKIGIGLVVLLGIEKGDARDDALVLIKKILNLRIFDDSDNKMNLSIKEVRGSLLIISQFTLCADTRKGRRPSFLNAANPKEGERLYNFFLSELKKKYSEIESGSFGAMMNVELVNEGPATFILKSKGKINS